MHYTTKRDILDKHPCYIPDRLSGIKLDERISFKAILDEVCLADAVWCLCTLSYKDTCLFQADVAESVVHLADDDARLAIQAVRDWHAGKITDEKLNDAAFVAARAAAHAASTARAAARTARTAARAAAHAALTAVAAVNPVIVAVNPVNAVAHAALAAVNVNANARQECWADVEKLFVEHFCGE